MIAEDRTVPNWQQVIYSVNTGADRQHRYNPAMAEYLSIHPDNPQPRYIREAVERLRDGALLVYPTDSSYALGCTLDNKAGAERIRKIRQADRNHLLTLVCPDLSSIGQIARLDNWAYRLLRSLTPGPYTFILRGGGDLPARVRHKRRKTVGIRVPKNAICHELLEELGSPVLSSTLIMPGEDQPMNEPAEILDRLGHVVDLVIDGGHCPAEPTTVMDLTGGSPVILREGRGVVPA